MTLLVPPTENENRTLIDALLAEQRDLTAVERFARWHESHDDELIEPAYRRLLPATAPRAGEQFAFEVDLDKCSGCKACVSACHSLNGLDDDETWRSVGLLIGCRDASPSPLDGEGIPENDSRIEPLNHPLTRPSATLSPTGGEGRVRGQRTTGSFMERGVKGENFSGAFVQHVTTACHHCADPGCLNGCPVLAYDKDPLTGIVRHLDDQCIGCQYCVMKCPYEVPQYSKRLGIVRKCDMCSQRLAVGEAPACVQACPSEAIRITVVEQDKIRGRFRGLHVLAETGRGEKGKRGKGESSSAPFPLIPFSNSFLPDSPDPSITLPTTRFLSTKLPTDLVAADHAAPRLDNPHWPLAIMLALTQSAAGLFMAAAIAGTSGVVAGVKPLALVGFGTLCAGLAASVMHLGQPLKAWRAFLGWRRSWLSREIIALNLFAVVALLATLHPPSSVFAAAIGLAAVFSSAMVYVDTKRALWSAPFTFTNFYGTTLLLGASFAAVILGFSGAPARVTQIAACAALVIRTALFVWRRLHWRAALRNPANPIHFNARTVRALIPWTMRARTVLFASSTGFGLLALWDVASAAPLWASLAALTTFSSEIIVRYVFFAAGACKRMPGGVAA